MAGLRAVAGASFAVKRGSITALIGPNGAGKTTLFDLVTGFVHPDRGAIRFEGRAIAGLAPHRIARLGLVRTFQLTRVFAAMTMLENMMLAPLGQPGEIPPGADHPRRRQPAQRGAPSASAPWPCSAISICRTKSADYAGTLSGGQRKLLELARALMASPRMVLLDEPMAGVNRVLGKRLLDYVEELRRTTRCDLPLRRA